VGTLQDYPGLSTTRRLQHSIVCFNTNRIVSFQQFSDTYSTSALWNQPASPVMNNGWAIAVPIILLSLRSTFCVHSDCGMCSLHSTATVPPTTPPNEDLRLLSAPHLHYSTTEQHCQSLRNKEHPGETRGGSSVQLGLLLLCRVLVIVPALERQTFQCLCSAT
jgi:hypothetical protein